MKEICVITGGSKGLGKEIAKEMLANGKDVYLIARNAEELKAAKTELQKNCPAPERTILTSAGDISDETFVKNLFNELKSDYKISYLINNAGVGRYCKVTENTLEIINDVISASLIGTILVTSNAIPLMKENGTIATVMSTAALGGIANETAYAAAKWGQRGFVESLKTELENTRLNIVSIYPGGMDTQFWNKNRHYVSEQKSAGFMDAAELAKTIVSNLLEKTSFGVKEMVFRRLK